MPADNHADGLISAGYALRTLANLLGADGSEHRLSNEERQGVMHAVYALGGYVLDAGFSLGVAGESAREEGGNGE
jgi:hypothetical protein